MSRTTVDAERLRELVVCSLEPYDEVLRRNQLLIAALLEMEAHLRVLFVEPPVDVAFEMVARHHWRTGAGLRVPEAGGGRLTTFEPTKWLPRAAGPAADLLMASAVVRAARRLGFSHPTLWINDVAFAGLSRSTGWPTLYDVTDDWLEGSCTPRERLRRHRNEAYLLANAAEVVVCSAALARSKGAYRDVRLVTNAVDVEAMRTPAARPADLPPGKIVCYVGTLHEDRLDVDLCVSLARTLRDRATLVFVGPDSLTAESRRTLSGEASVLLLGARPHRAVPAYLQHADVLVVPHVVTAFTESLDPIKAYEYRAVGGPVVATPVSGFRGLGPPVKIAAGDEFVREVAAAVSAHHAASSAPVVVDGLPTWRSQAEAMREVLCQVGAGPSPSRSVAMGPHPYELAVADDVREGDRW